VSAGFGLMVAFSWQRLILTEYRAVMACHRTIKVSGNNNACQATQREAVFGTDNFKEAP